MKMLTGWAGLFYEGEANGLIVVEAKDRKAACKAIERMGIDVIDPLQVKEATVIEGHAEHYTMEGAPLSTPQDEAKSPDTP